MFTHILVPVDLGRRNARALRVALELARTSRARVTLLHVVQAVPSLTAGELADFYARLARTATRKLEATARQFVRAGVRVRTEQCVGEPAREIVRRAAQRHAELVVLGSHRVRRGRPATALGTTSHRVAIFCECPVLLVK